MSERAIQFCPKCNRRALRIGKCLQCGYRGAGLAQLGPKDRQRQANRPKKRLAEGTIDDVDVDFSSDIDLVGTDDVGVT